MAITDILITSHHDRLMLSKAVISNINKCDAICLFIQPTVFPLNLNNYLPNSADTSFMNIFFVINTSDINLIEAKHVIFQLKTAVATYNLKNNANIKCENENVFIFDDKAVEQVMDLSEYEENGITIEKPLFESCKYSMEEMKRFFSTLFSILPQKTKHFNVKIGKNIVHSIELVESENVETILSLKKLNDEIILEVEKNSMKVVHTYYLPSTTFVILKIFFKWDEQIIVEVLPLFYAITISPSQVVTYNSSTNNIESFSSAIDYKDTIPLIGVNYDSSTVIKDAMIALGQSELPKHASNGMTIGELRGFPEIIYFIQTNQKSKIVNPESAVAELLKEATKDIQNRNDEILLTIPRHFYEPQKAAYRKAAKFANLLNIEFVDEIVALAYGFEEVYKFSENVNYVLIHYSYPNFTISTIKSGIIREKEIGSAQIEFVDLKEWETKFFDAIIADASTDKNVTSLDMDRIDQLFEKINDTVLGSTYIVVSGSHLLHKIITDCFPQIETIFINNSEALIAQDANLAYYMAKN